ncbi:MAG: 2-oxo-4-hydroxy-4-carboxy-5-ureidoimidazoline decarboxylase [Candidatus Azotimanducaceae bacterium]|jgi:2-oxo-4-hydroxy-4-carboxy-5-ureidoimidazoline decarboxylase
MIINHLSVMEKRAALLKCCSSQAWVDLLLLKYPFESIAALIKNADECWIGLKETDYLEAFSGHPKIGDLESLREKYAETASLASVEQVGTMGADEDVLKMLAVGNKSYEKKFGFIFIVCASGKSADEMLNLLQARMVNDRETELINAAEQQRQIFHIRLKQLGQT